jgi:hypothetical protein
MDESPSGVRNHAVVASSSYRLLIFPNGLVRVLRDRCDIRFADLHRPIDLVMGMPLEVVSLLLAVR